MTTQEDVTEESSFGSENSSEGDADNKDAGEESLQMSLLTSQEFEEPPVSVLSGAEPATGETGYGAWEELKPAKDAGTEDIEVAISKVASTMGDLTPASSQDAVSIHTPEEEVRSLK